MHVAMTSVKCQPLCVRQNLVCHSFGSPPVTSSWPGGDMWLYVRRIQEKTDSMSLTRPSTVPSHYNMVNFLQNPHNRHPISSPLRARYGVSLVILISYSLSTTVITVLYVISWYIRPHYNGTWLHSDLSKLEVPKDQNNVNTLCIEISYKWSANILNNVYFTRKINEIHL